VTRNDDDDDDNNKKKKKKKTAVTENWRKWQYKDLHYLQSSSDINGVINQK
jgi:hypothetical protein